MRQSGDRLDLDRAGRGAAEPGRDQCDGLEWGAHPALLAREIASQCREGLLRHTEPEMESFRQAGGWADRRKSRPYNLFYGDIEADAEVRLAAWRAQDAD